jgi:isoamylase
MATLLLSQGVPMLLAGDEFLRTQQGNNNAWCQDNDISWVNWDLATQNASFQRFVREMIALRKRHSSLRRRDFLRGTGPLGNSEPDVIWHGARLGQPDFSAGSNFLAYVLDGSQTGREPDKDLCVACKSGRDAVSFRIPPSPSGQTWRRVVDTALASPLDIVDEEQGPKVAFHGIYAVAPFSCVVLISE